ncbi:MAG: hypothetical protein ACOYNN_11065 [Terrimicrobiaceae bacterium]
MKYLPAALAFAAMLGTLRAHDHVEIGLDPSNPGKLKAIAGPSEQLATYFPSGETPSYDTPAFPGNAYATVLTFSAFDNTSPPPNGASVRVELLAVSGPVGGSFSYWEIGATNATWTRPSAWVASPTDQPSLEVSEDETGYGHIHGRAFSMDKPGIYDVTFRAVDASGEYANSDVFTVRFTAVTPPQLAISASNGSVRLTFTSRESLAYDVQVSTTLQPSSWTTIDTLDGTGGQVEFFDPLNARPRVFYRLVEYR